MTNEIESSESHGIVLRGLPWLLGLGALVLYGVTLNHWVSILNLENVAKVSGWSWQPEFTNPAYYLLRLPFTLLPEAAVPVALNALSAVGAALVLIQLARCVTLLPHDRTQAQRERELSDGAVFTGKFSWVPPVLAVLMCGLQLTFWEHATNGTGEMLDLLMFAFVVRAILEYRLDGRERWLARAALVMGAGMSSNVAMIAFFPLFLGSLVWVRGVSFFNVRFLVRTLIFGVAGLSLCLLLPVIVSIKTPELASFWTALQANVNWQVEVLRKFPRMRLVLLSLWSVLPILIISIRWASYFGDTSQTGQRITTVMFHGMHAFFLGAIFWVALDPPFSPRNAGYDLPFLPLYFMGALGAGYFSGYFLLVFGPLLERRMRRTPTPLLDILHRVSTVAVLLLLVATPIALVWRNFAELRKTNGSMIRDYAASLMEGLPARCVLVSDEPARQFIVQAWLAATGRTKDYVVLNSDWLKWDTYHQRLHKQHGSVWPAPEKVEGKPNFAPNTLIAMLAQTARSNQVFYLHPSFGYYFEAFYVEPHGLAYGLKPYGANELLPPKHSAETVTNTEAFLTRQMDTLLTPVLSAMRRESGAGQYVGTGLLRKVKLRRHKNQTAQLLGKHYSRALNLWGVELQKAENFEAAGKWFELATKLNPENVVAERNLEFNRRYRAGEKPVVEIPKSVEDLFGADRNWNQVLTANGPYDDPSLCLLQAYLFVQTGLYRQSAQCFDRVRFYSDTDFASRLWLAQLQLLANQPDAALALTTEIHEHPDRFPLDITNRLELLAVETSALFARKDAAKAAGLIETLLATDPRDERLLTAALSLYNRYGQFTNSLTVVERQLAINPDNPSALLNKGYVANQLGKFDESVAALTKLLTLETNNPYALLNRATAYLHSNQLPQAKADYENLIRQYPTAFQAYYDLTEVALRNSDTNAAVRYAETFLSNSATNTAEYQAMSERLRSIKGGNPK